MQCWPWAVPRESHEQLNVEARFWNLRGIQYQDRWKFSGCLCVILPWDLDLYAVVGNSMAFLFLKFHLKMQIMDEINCKLCKSQRSRSGKTVINEPPQWQCSTKCCIEEWNWKEQMRNIGSEEIQVNNSNKSNCTASLQKGGQIGGCWSGGSSEIMCDEIFYQIGTNLFSTSRIICGSNYTPFCVLKFCYGCENDLQSWNPTF